jgi:hypothetical protein
MNINKEILLTLRIDKETRDLISYLKQNKVRYTDIIRDEVKNRLKEKAKEFKFKESKKYCPF